jgi:uncharacterized tellurite resistance protein B-like protein
MLDRIRRFVADLAQAEAPPEFTEDDHRVAAAALLVHIMEADGVVNEGERTALHRLIKDSFGLDDAEAERLAAEARHRDEEAIDLYAFTSVLKRHLDRDQRLRLIEMMWTMVFADGTVSELEDNIVWRVAELLGIETRDRVVLKHRIAARAEAGTPKAG